MGDSADCRYIKTPLPRQIFPIPAFDSESGVVRRNAVGKHMNEYVRTWSFTRC